SESASGGLSCPLRKDYANWCVIPDSGCGEFFRKGVADDSRRIEPFPHADPLLDAVAELLVEGDHLPVGRSDLQIDLEATACGQGLLQTANEESADPKPALPGIDRDGVHPAAMTVVAAHDR